MEADGDGKSRQPGLEAATCWRRPCDVALREHIEVKGEVLSDGK